MGSRIDVEKRLMAKIDMSDKNGCWPWTGKIDSLGYGRINMPGNTVTGHRQALAHRVSYELATGIDITGKVVRHKCDNPPCCNPAHLIHGEQKDNIMDMIERGSASTHRGEQNGRAKLTESDVATIKALLLSGVSMYRVAKNYGIGHSTVTHIQRGNTWSWVNAADAASRPGPS